MGCSLSRDHEEGFNDASRRCCAVNKPPLAKGHIVSAQILMGEVGDSA